MFCLVSYFPEHLPSVFLTVRLMVVLKVVYAYCYWICLDLCVVPKNHSTEPSGKDPPLSSSAVPLSFLVLQSSPQNIRQSQSESLVSKKQ